MAIRPYVVPVRFTVGTQVLQATTGALGVDSAFVCCLVPPRQGEHVSMRFYLADDRPVEVLNYDELDVPAVMRNRGRGRGSMTPDFSNPEVSESYDIPAFLRKQAD